MNKILVAMAAAAALSTPIAGAPVQAPGEEASIPFVRLNGIRDFRPVGDDVVYLQDRAFKWYRASLYQPCFRYRHVNKIGIADRGNTVDRFSSLLVDGRRCRIASLVRSDGPPRKKDRRRTS